MHKFKQWLFERFLPAYVDESYRENIAALQRDNARLRAYARGLETAIRNQRRIYIRNEVVDSGICKGYTDGKHNTESA